MSPYTTHSSHHHAVLLITLIFAILATCAQQLQAGDPASRRATAADPAVACDGGAAGGMVTLDRAPRSGIDGWAVLGHARRQEAAVRTDDRAGDSPLAAARRTKARGSRTTHLFTPGAGYRS